VISNAIPWVDVLHGYRPVRADSKPPSTVTYWHTGNSAGFLPVIVGPINCLP